MNIIALVTHLKLVAQEAKKYAASLASELSNATLEAMQEMDRAKVDRLSSVSVTIKADGWVEDETWEEYPMRYDITAADVTATDRADIILSPNSLTAAMDWRCLSDLRNADRENLYLGEESPGGSADC